MTNIHMTKSIHHISLTSTRQDNMKHVKGTVSNKVSIPMFCYFKSAPGSSLFVVEPLHSLTKYVPNYMIPQTNYSVQNVNCSLIINDLAMCALYLLSYYIAGPV